MKATETKFLNFLKGPKQFLIPIYQRTYSWTIAQCDQLWKDLLRVAKDEVTPGHFVGSVVYIERGLYHISTVPQLLVIDGQQRLTTLTILLGALGRELEKRGESGEISMKKIYSYYLMNNEEEGDFQHKLLLTQSDKATLIQILNGKELPENPSHRLVENNKFFEDQLAKPGVDLNTIYQGIAKLIIVDIALDRDHDNPQRIFESLNSTGLELSQADLIRNYVLMGLEPKEQDRLYLDYWFPMEQSFGQTEYASQFDRFMRDYLTLKSGSIPNIRAVYAAFKDHAQSGKHGDVGEIVADIYRYSKYFVRMALGRETDPELKRVFDDISTLKVDVAYPFLMEVYDLFASKRIDRPSFVAILRLVESFVFRRAICGIPTHALNKLFAVLPRELYPENCLESCQAALLLRDSYRRFPDDAEFQRELVQKDVYNFRNRNYLLRKLENHDRKEPIVLEEYTIEHILPQNPQLDAEWREELGPNWKQVQDRYLHTIGNLTLTGYNPELSDRPFLQKRDMEGGFRDSPIRLNKQLAKLERWTAEEIENRALSLADAAIKAWSYPPLDASTLEIYRLKRSAPPATVYTLADHPKLTGPMLELFEHLRKRILNIDSSVREEILKLYIAYKADTNFVDVQAQEFRLVLTLNMPYGQINDPNLICRDVSGVGHQANGDVQVMLSRMDQLDMIMDLVRQSFEWQVEEPVSTV